MKKLLAVLLSISMLFSLCACGGDKKNEKTDGKAESQTEAPKISKEEYEKMTADDLFNAIVKSSDCITADEYAELMETYQYVDIAASVMELEKNITDEVRLRIISEYSSDQRPLASEWVPRLITHKAPQVRAKAFTYSMSVYDNRPEFLATVKK